MQNKKIFSKKRVLRKFANRMLILALILATAGNSFVPVAAASVMPEAKKAVAVPASGNYLWQSVEAGDLGGTEKSAQYAGYQFLSQKDAYVTELCGYFKGTHAVNLYDETYKLLTSAQITGYEQWNCAAISPVALAPQKKYFVVAEISTGPVYYRFGAADLLPRKGGDGVIEAGITQPITLPFGTKIKSATDRVFGLVDLKITSAKNAKALIGKTGASLADAVGGLAGSELRTGKTSDHEIARNCGRGKCIVCSDANCRIENDTQAKDQKENTFNQICLKGSCWSCTNGNCAMTDAAGIVKTGYSYKSCANNKCVNCLNDQCDITGGSVPQYLYQFGSTGGFGGFSNVGAWSAASGGGGVSYDTLTCSDCVISGGVGGGGSFSPEDAAKAMGMMISGKFTSNDKELSDALQKAVVAYQADALSKGFPSTVPSFAQLATFINGAAGKQLVDTNAAAAKDQAQINQNINQLSTGSKAAVKIGYDKSATASHSQDLLDEISSGLHKTVVDKATGKVTTIEPENPNSNAFTRPSSLASKKDGNFVAVKITDPVAKGSKITVPNQAFKNSDGSITYVEKSTFTVPDAKTATDINTLHYLLFPTSTAVPASDFNAVASSVKYGTGAAAVKVGAGNIVGVYDPSLTVSSIAAIGMPKQAAATLAAATPVATTAAVDSFSLWLDTGTGSTGASGQSWGDMTYTGSTNGASTGSGISSIKLGGNGVTSGSGSTPVKLGSSGSGAANANSEAIIKGIRSEMSTTVVDKNTGAVTTLPPTTAKTSDLSRAWGSTVLGKVVAEVEITKADGTRITAANTQLHDPISYIPAAMNPDGSLDKSASPTTHFVTEQDMQGLLRGDVLVAKVVANEPLSLNSGIGSTFQPDSKTGNGNAVTTAAPGGGNIITMNPVASKSTYDPTAASGGLPLTSSQTSFLGDTSGESYAVGSNAAVSTNNADSNALDAANAQGNTSAAWLAQPDGSNVNMASSNAIDGNIASQAAGNGTSKVVSCPACDAAEMRQRDSELDAAQSGNSAALEFFQSDDPNANLALKKLNSKNNFGLKNVDSWFGNIAAKAMVVIDKLIPKTLAAVDDSQKTNAGPVVIDYEPSITSSMTPTINIETGTKAVCKAAPYDLEYDFMWSGLETVDGKTHHMKFGELSDGNYVFYVRCQDEAGNVNRASQRISFMVDKTYDPKIDINTMPPAVSGAKADISDLAAVLRVSLKGNVAVSEAEARIYGADGRLAATVLLSSADDGNGWSHDWQGAVGAKAGNYTIDIFAKDASGNFVEKKNAGAFTLKLAANGNNFIAGGDCKNLGSGGLTADKINLVFVPCGYGSDFKTFEKDAAVQMEQFYQISPVAQSLDKFNFTAVEFPGLDCGAELADNIKKDTNLFEQIARPCNPSAVLVLKKNADSQGGISAPGSMTAFISAGSPTAAIHEIGHVIFGLDDEYSYGCTYTGMTNSSNCSDSPKCEKWQGLAGAGCFAGCTCEGDYRSSNDSVMLDPAHATAFSPAASRQVGKILNLFK